MQKNFCIDGLGPTNLPVRLACRLNLAKIQINAEEGFVLSRIDGVASIELLCLITGLGEQNTLTILKRLHERGYILIGDEEEREPPPPTPSPATEDLGPCKEGDDSDIDLKQDICIQIESLYSQIGELNLFELLGVSYDADAKEIRNAFTLKSKFYHPDRYFKKKMGPYKAKLQDIFKEIRAAYKTLSDDKKRGEYLQQIRLKKNQEELVYQETHQEVNLSQSIPTKSIDSLVSQEDDDSLGGYAIISRKGAKGKQLNGSESCHMIERLSIPSHKKHSKKTSISSPKNISSEHIVLQPSPENQTTMEIAPEEDNEERVSRRETNHRLRSKRVTGALFSRGKRAKELYLQGKKEFDEGDYLASSASLKLAVTYNPDEIEYRKLYHQSLEKTKELTAENYFKQGQAEESIGRYDAAKINYIRAADFFEKSEYLCKAAEILLKSHELIKAKDYATKAVCKEPNSPENRVVLARVYIAAKLKQNARRELNAALSLQPNHSLAKSLLKEC